MWAAPPNTWAYTAKQSLAEDAQLRWLWEFNECKGDAVSMEAFIDLNALTKVPVFQVGFSRPRVKFDQKALQQNGVRGAIGETG